MRSGLPHNVYHAVPVHEEDLAPVYELLATRERQRAAIDPPTGSTAAGQLKVYIDSNLVLSMYRDSEERHRALLRALAEADGRWLYTSDLAQMLGVKTGSKGMAGMFGAFGRRAKHRYKGLKPWESSWDPIRNEARYRMEPEVSRWVKAAAESGDS